MKDFNFLAVLFVLLFISACNGPEEDKQEIGSDTETYNQSNEGVTYPSDTVVYHAESNTKGEEGYTQTLKVVHQSDSTMWFNIRYENMMAGGKVQGVAIDTLSHTGLETFEHNGIENPAMQYSYEERGFRYHLLLSKEDSSLVKLNIESDIPTDAIPLQIVMERVGSDSGSID